MSTVIEADGVYTIEYEKFGDLYASDIFTAEGSSIAIHIEFAKAGSCTLYKGIDMENMVPALALTRWGATPEVVERNVGGIVPGQFLRIVFNEGVEPKDIMVLHGPAGGSGTDFDLTAITDAEIDAAWNV